MVVGLRFQFGCRNSPGFWGLTAAALEHSHNYTSFREARLKPSDIETSASVSTFEWSQARAFPLPSGCGQLRGAGGGPGDVFFVRSSIDYGILVEVQWVKDERRCVSATQSLPSDHFTLLGGRGPRAPSLLPPSKMCDWSATIEVPAWWIDTNNLTRGLNQKKREILVRTIGDRSASRRHASVRKIQG